jgi:hypothetical protein
MRRTVLDIFKTQLKEMPDAGCTVFATGNPEKTDFVVPVLDLANNEELEGRINISSVRYVIRKDLEEPEYGLFDKLEILEFYEGSRNATFMQSKPTPGAAEQLQALLNSIYAVPGYDPEDDNMPAQLSDAEINRINNITDSHWKGRSWIFVVRPPHYVQLTASSDTGFSLSIMNITKKINE